MTNDFNPVFTLETGVSSWEDDFLSTRGEKVILPRGNTRLQGEDRVEIVGHEEQLLQAETCLAS